MKTGIVLFLTIALAFGADLEKFATSSRQFTADIYDEILVDNSENILVSPFSVETILALTQSGAVGKTAQEIRTALYLPETEEETRTTFKDVLPSFKNDEYILHTANKVYVEEGYAIKDDFKAVASDVYQAAFESIEFAENEDAAKEINEWVEKETEDKIHNLVTPDSLDATTRVVLVNALYFKANWSVPFEPYLTKTATFFAPDEKTVDADTMYRKSEQFNYYESEELDAKYLELPFQGQDASMTFILPNKKEGIAILEKQKSAILATPKYTKEFVEVSLPKFKIESTIDFKEVLGTLGVEAAFNPLEADFSGIAGEKGEILISQITQKTFIDVNEIGVEAAAATEIAEPSSVPPDATKSFIADHPFAFYIKVNGIVLFEGRVLEPSNSSN